MENKERDFKGVWIKKEIWLNTNLTLIEKVLIVEIDSLDNSERGCFASNEYLAKFVNLSEGRVANIISDLKKREFIIQLFFDGRNRGLRTNKLKCESSFNENVKAEYTKTGKQNTQKREYNNTENKTSNNTIDKGCEFDNSLPKTDINNPFKRQSILDDISYEQKIKERKIVAEQKERKEREPSETYLCFSAFASTYERLAGVTYPSDKGNYIMTAKDGANCKKLVTWLKKVSASEQAPEDMVQMFTTAAWQISDKWLKANFTISNIYSQANNIYTKFLYASPLAKEKKRQEEIDKLVNEFTA
jgi:hypothetical protein